MPSDAAVIPPPLPSDLQASIPAIYPHLYTDSEMYTPGQMIGVAKLLARRCHAAEQERDELRGEVHDCPTCHRKCKECDCVEQRIAALEAERDHWKANHDEPDLPADRSPALKALEAERDALRVEVVQANSRLANMDDLKLAAKEEREACAQIADDCAAERVHALTDFPIVLTPARSTAYYSVAAKESEARRIAEAIRARSQTPLPPQVPPSTEGVGLVE